MLWEHLIVSASFQRRFFCSTLLFTGHLRVIFRENVPVKMFYATGVPVTNGIAGSQVRPDEFYLQSCSLFRKILERFHSVCKKLRSEGVMFLLLFLLHASNVSESFGLKGANLSSCFRSHVCTCRDLDFGEK